MINPELQKFSFDKRVQSIARSLSGVTTLENFNSITTRGKKKSASQLLPLLKTRIETGRYGAILLDSIYKLYPIDIDENSNAAVGAFLNDLESLASKAGASIIYSHHFSKGNQSMKEALDRASGAGAFTRDPDTIVNMTKHSTEKCYTVDFTLRDFPPVEPYVIRVNWPNVQREPSLNPKDLKTTQFTNKYTKADILHLLLEKSYTATEIQREAKAELGMGERTFYQIWPEVKKVPGVELKDRRWSYKTQDDVANN